MRKFWLSCIALLLSAAGAMAQSAGQLPSGYVWGNSSASAGQGAPASLTAMFNRALCGTQNNIPIRGASLWACGTISALLSQGTGINLSGTTVVTVALANTAVTPNSYGSATQCVSLTINAQGQITAASAVTCAPAFSSITGLSANTVLGSIGGGNAAGLTQTQLTALCNAFTSLLSGCAPASGGGTSNYLRADGMWTSPSSASGVSSIAGNTGAFTLGAGLGNSTNVLINTGVVTVKKQIFNTSGTYTPSTGMLFALIECVGSSGGSGNANHTASDLFIAPGSGSGSYSRTLASAGTIGASQTITIGTPGSAGASGGTTGGTAGGDTSVGTLCIGKGSPGSNIADLSHSDVRGGVGGVAGTGDLTIPGNAGGAGFYATAAGVLPIAGQGAPSYFGGAPQQAIFSAAGVVGAGCGAGSSGANTGSTANFAGAPGKAGCVFITEYNSQ